MDRDSVAPTDVGQTKKSTQLYRYIPVFEEILITTGLVEAAVLVYVLREAPNLLWLWVLGIVATGSVVEAAKWAFRGIGAALSDWVCAAGFTDAPPLASRRSMKKWQEQVR